MNKTTATINGVEHEVWDLDGVRVGQRLEAIVRVFSRKHARYFENRLVGDVTFVGRGPDGHVLSIKINTSLVSANRGNRWISRMTSQTVEIGEYLW